MIKIRKHTTTQNCWRAHFVVEAINHCCVTFDFLFPPTCGVISFLLRNDGISALAIAEASNADFVRINVLNNLMYTDQGIIEGKAYEVSQFKSTLSKWKECKIFIIPGNKSFE